MKSQLGLLFLIAGALLLTNCKKEYFDLDKLSDEVEIHPKLVAPLVFGSLNIGDLVEYVDSSGYAHEFDDGLVYLAYTDTVVNVMADSMVEIPDALYTESFLAPDVDIPDFMESEPGDIVHFLKSKFIAIQLEGDDRVDSMRVKGGEILFEILSTFKHNGYVNISSEQIIDPRGVPFFVTLVASDVSGEFENSARVLTEYYFIETFEKGDSNVIQIDFDLALTNSGNPVEPDDLCQIDLNFLDMGFYSVYGYIDSRNTFEESGSLEIPFYAENRDLAAVKFADPRINVFSTNSVGVPSVITLNSVISNGLDGSSVTLEFYEGHPFVVSAPDLSQIGSSVSDEFHINRETSNFNELLSNAPTSLSYTVSGSTQQGTGDESHFALDTSRLVVETEFLLPLDFRSTIVAMEDTMEFEMDDQGIDTSMVRQVNMTISTVNELPIKLDLQVYLLDEFYQVLDSVFEDEQVFLAASEVDQQGKLIQAGEEANTAMFPAEKLSKLGEIRFLQVHARMNTSELGSKDVKLYSDYSLDFKLSMIADLIINSREL
jgi:hypothetical protein